jgi:hypothetical protein
MIEFELRYPYSIEAIQQMPSAFSSYLYDRNQMYPEVHFIVTPDDKERSPNRPLGWFFSRPATGIVNVSFVSQEWSWSIRIVGGASVEGSVPRPFTREERDRIADFVQTGCSLISKEPEIWQLDEDEYFKYMLQQQTHVMDETFVSRYNHGRKGNVRSLTGALNIARETQDGYELAVLGYKVCALEVCIKSSPVWFRAIATGERLPLVEYELYLLGPINKMKPPLKEIVFAVQDTLHPTDAILLRSLQDAGLARVEHVQVSLDGAEFDTLFNSGSARLSKMNQYQ